MRAILSIPSAYRLQQSLVWSSKRDFHALLAHLVDLISREKARKARVLDIGCGDGKLAKRIGQLCDYTGIDISEAYIRHARTRYSAFGEFHVADLADTDFRKRFENIDPDLILLIGVMHHCDDAAIRTIVDQFISCFPQAKFLSADGVYLKKQNPIARLILRMDRGNYIRTIEGYRRLLPDYEYLLDNYLRIPFDIIVFFKGFDLKAASKAFFENLERDGSKR